MARILIIRFSALGDVAMTIPVIHSLAVQYPQLEITVLSRAVWQPLFQGLPANVSFIGADLTGKHKGLWGLNTLYSELKAKRFDYVADFHHVLRTKYLCLRFRLANIPVASICKGRAGKEKLVRRRHKVLENQKSSFRRYADVLEKLAPDHPIVSKILEYRQLAKLKSTYCDGLTAVVNPNTHRIHSVFTQTVTVTGRLSSTEPNLQNIPTRTELGREIRKMFVAKDGYVLVDADYSQIELRVLAHIANDETMINAFRNNEDIHAVTASQVLGIPLEDVTKEQRSSAKAVNFGIVYGIGEFSLAQDLHISVKEAKAYIESYLEKYHGVRNYMESIKEQAKKDGYVKTMLNRIRYIPELKSPNYNIRQFGERVALNTPIQGTAADIIKLAMVRVDNRLINEGLKSKLILQVHDELIVEAHKDEVDKVKQILSEEMQGAMELNVPLKVDMSTGHSWYDAK